MYIKKLVISTPTSTIRSIDFKMGMNLIVDDTPLNDSKATGNNVGKTTVLKLIDFCLGAKAKYIYSDDEEKNKVYDIVKDFLIDNNVIITLLLSEDLNNPSAREVEIRRNFLTHKKAIREINGKAILTKDFEAKLEEIILPGKDVEKPTFRQVISHNIRYKDISINNTLKMLDSFTTDIEYETLYLYLLGCNNDEGEKKQLLATKIKQEEAFKKRLEKKQTKSAYEITLSLVEENIRKLNEKKALFNLNEDYEKDLEELNYIKYDLNKKSSHLSKLKIRKNLIDESITELRSSHAEIDLSVLKSLYDEATLNVSEIQRTFEDLISYHNNMIVEKIKFISRDLPNLESLIINAEHDINLLLEKEKMLSMKISKGNSFEELEKVIAELNNQYRQKGEYENIISQLNEVEDTTNNLSKEIDEIDKYIFSKDFTDKLDAQLKKFNMLFADISSQLYGEQYLLKYDISEKNGRSIYKFSSFNANFGDGKKQGEILCFDLAHIMFSIEEKIPTLKFLLNDKKELMHINQLIKVSSFVKKEEIQLIASILKDKLHEDVIANAHIAVELSQKSKLFMIEE